MTIVIDKNSELKVLAKAIFAGVATPEDMGKVAVAEVIAIKSDTSEPRRAFIPIEKVTKGAKGEGERVRRFVASSERPDRGGDVVRVAGWDLKDFRANPIALWCHLSRDLPLGTVVEMTKAPKEDPPCLYEAIEFAAGERYPFADQVLGFIDDKIIRGVSVGFIPLKGGVYYPQTQEERDTIGLGPWGVEYRKQSQLELSVCNIPMQADSLSTKAQIEKAIGDLVRAKKLTETEGKALIDAAAEPVVFAVTAPAQASKAEDPAPVAKDEDTDAARMVALLERFADREERLFAALDKTLAANTDLRTRIEALERNLAATKTKAIDAPAAPVTQASTDPTSRMSASGAFFERVFARLN